MFGIGEATFPGTTGEEEGARAGGTGGAGGRGAGGGGTEQQSRGTVARVENLSPAMGREIDSRNRVWHKVAKLHRLAGRYDNPMPTWFLAPIAGLKLPTQCSGSVYNCLPDPDP